MYTSISTSRPLLRLGVFFPQDSFYFYKCFIAAGLRKQTIASSLIYGMETILVLYCSRTSGPFIIK